MVQFPEIIHPEYHKMSFEDIDNIRKKITSGKAQLLIKETALFLYLNQMEGKYSSKLKFIQNISIFCLVGAVVFIFINWRISPGLFIIAIIAHVYSRKLARKFIYKQCSEDHVFLKFALGVGLVQVQDQ